MATSQESGVSKGTLRTAAKTDSANTYTQPQTFSGGLSVTVPIYASNAAAITGGLVAGDVYRTGADPDALNVVH
ncbi:MAG: hypothetical protein V3S69_05350 [Dehalococcoidales bacterium]